jgi:hypothetical protein
VSPSRSLGGAHRSQARLPHPFARLTLTHSPSLPTHTRAHTRTARHDDHDTPGSCPGAATRPPDPVFPVGSRISAPIEMRRSRHLALAT